MAKRDIDEHLESVEWGKQQEDGEVLLSPSWEVFVLGVSILSVFNLLVVIFIRNPDIDQVFVIMDSILTVVFVVDLTRRLVVAQERRRYLIHGYGWIDLLAAFPILRILRLVRSVKMISVMQRLGGPFTAFKAFFSNKAAGGLLSVLLIALLVMEFGALAILAVERGAPGANIENASDAIWYLLVTMSTVGYGDYYPVTDMGRLFGGLIIVVGVGVFGTLTGFLANTFLAPSPAVAAATTPEIIVDDEIGDDSLDQEADPVEREADPGA
jgi:voltage-gated potassium channel